MDHFQEGLEKIIKEGLAEKAFPGASYVLVTKNKVYTGALGYTDYENNEEVKVTTLYDMASLTKVVSTTTAIMILLQRGLIRLGDPVSRFLPNFKHSNVLLFHLVTHTSGLPEGVMGQKDELTANEIWDKIYAYDLKYPLGEKIIYSDINYILLGKIIEVVSGKALEDFVRDEIFLPLSMKDTGYLPKDATLCAPTEHLKGDVTKPLIRGFVHDETAQALGGVAGHAGLFSNAVDLVNFIKMILNRGEFAGKRILSKKVVDALFVKNAANNDPTLIYPSARTIGWQYKEMGCSAGDLISEETIYHTGFTGTNLFIDRKNGVGFALLSNRVCPTRNNSRHLHYRACLGNYIIANLDQIGEE